MYSNNISPQQLVTSTGFHNAFTTMLKKTPFTQTVIFEKLNKIYAAEYGQPRYSSFNSYRNCRAKWLRK